jgi:ankyrin repeat protein
MNAPVDVDSDNESFDSLFDSPIDTLETTDDEFRDIDLVAAVQDGDCTVVVHILNRDAANRRSLDVNTRVRERHGTGMMSLLHWAISDDSEDIVRLLLDHPNINKEMVLTRPRGTNMDRTHLRATPFLFACHYGSANMVKMLHEAGCISTAIDEAAEGAYVYCFYDTSAIGELRVLEKLRYLRDVCHLNTTSRSAISSEIEANGRRGATTLLHLASKYKTFLMGMNIGYRNPNLCAAYTLATTMNT